MTGINRIFREIHRFGGTSTESVPIGSDGAAKGVGIKPDDNSHAGPFRGVILPGVSSCRTVI